MGGRQSNGRRSLEATKGYGAGPIHNKHGFKYIEDSLIGCRGV